MYIAHLTLSTGHVALIEPGAVADATVQTIEPWLKSMVATREMVPLPVDGLSDFTARGASERGALLLTVFGRTTAGGLRPPLVTLGVAKRARHGDEIWPLLVDLQSALGKVSLPPKHGLRRPSEPWCAVQIHRTIDHEPGASQWLGDFERCVAWTWMTMSQSTQGEH